LVGSLVSTRSTNEPTDQDKTYAVSDLLGFRNPTDLILHKS